MDAIRELLDALFHAVAVEHLLLAQELDQTWTRHQNQWNQTTPQWHRPHATKLVCECACVDQQKVPGDFWLAQSWCQKIGFPARGEIDGSPTCTPVRI